jgi:hypothetical protein
LGVVSGDLRFISTGISVILSGLGVGAGVSTISLSGILVIFGICSTTGPDPVISSISSGNSSFCSSNDSFFSGFAF